MRLVVPFVSWTALVGGALASNYEEGNSTPFLLFGLAVGPIAMLARAWSTVGSDRTAARTGRVVVSAASVFGAAFLLLEAIDVRYLEGFGL